MAIDKVHAAARGAATQCHEAFAGTLKGMLGHAIEIAEAFEKQAREIYNLNLTLHNKREPEKSVEVEPKKYKT